MVVLGLWLHSRGILGGGDVKLLVAIGTLVGYPNCIALLLYTGVGRRIACGRSSAPSRTVRPLRTCDRGRIRGARSLVHLSSGCEVTPMNRRTLAIVVAAVLAVGAGLLMFDYLLSVNHTPTSPPRTVLVAAQDIAARSTITAEQRAGGHSPCRYGRSECAFKAERYQARIGRFHHHSRRFDYHERTHRAARRARHCRCICAPDMRAVAIPVDIVKAIAGLVQPGDTVDVIAVRPSRSAGAAESLYDFTEHPRARSRFGD